jgi:hypothetical protein
MISGSPVLQNGSELAVARIFSEPEMLAFIRPLEAFGRRFLAELRPRVQSCIPAEDRQALWRELVNSLLPLLREANQAGARQAAESILQRVRDSAVATAQKDPAS